MDNQKPFCDRLCKNDACELNRRKIPSDIYVEKAIYPFCENFVPDDYFINLYKFDKVEFERIVWKRNS